MDYSTCFTISFFLLTIITGIMTATPSTDCEGNHCKVNLDRLDYSEPERVCPLLLTSRRCLEAVARSCPTAVDIANSQLTAEIDKYDGKILIHCAATCLAVPGFILASLLCLLHILLY